MVDSVSERIQARMAELGISQAEIMRFTGAARGSVSGWVNGSNSPSAKHLKALADCLKTTTEWVLTGKNNDGASSQLIPISTWDSDTPLDDDEVEIPFFKDFSFACGSGCINEHIANEKRKLRMSKATLRNLGITKDNAVAATASGDSMSPTISDGDTIHIDLGRKNIKDGKIFAVCIGGLFYCKRLYNLSFGGVRIVSDNSEEFEEIRLTAEEIEQQQFNVVGWIWQISRLERW